MLDLRHGDCLELMQSLPDGSIDLILCDLPYGTTACKWDVVIPFAPLWEQYQRVIKRNGAIVLTASQPFTTALIASNMAWFKYDFVWDKVGTTGFLNAKTRPLRRHESVLVFYKNQPTYNPQMEIRGKVRAKGSKRQDSACYRGHLGSIVANNVYHPTSVIKVSNACKNNLQHPTQKPVALLEYLILTYSNKGETVLDNCMGSGSTGVACVNTGRDFIGFELDAQYFAIARARICGAEAAGN